MTKFLCVLSVLFAMHASIAQSDDINREPSLVDYDAYMNLVKEVHEHRSDRLISVEQMKKMIEEQNTIILDTRSKEMYAAKHVKGAIHLNFSDFTQLNLMKLIPDVNTRIIIYCNNNFKDDRIYFATKSYVPTELETLQMNTRLSSDSNENNELEFAKPLGITMALNIPTYINLYGYGYKNVYELKDLISVFDEVIEFEGTAIDE